MACPQVNEEDVKRLLEEAFSYSRNDIIYIKSLGELYYCIIIILFICEINH